MNIGAFLQDPTNVAFVAFTAFFLLLWRLNVHTMILGMLDKRSQEIAKELHVARRLREDAENLLREYQAKRVAAEAEAKAIVATAKEQAAAVAAVEPSSATTTSKSRSFWPASERSTASSASSRL